MGNKPDDENNEERDYGEYKVESRISTLQLYASALCILMF